MDLEDLNVTQIILLVLLLTFVTSIATGIVTVALLAQAPPAVTQTINHIIQRTVEAVQPATGASKATIIKETTVVVKEDDLVTNSIAVSFSKLGSVRGGISTTSPMVALGVPIAGGLILTDSASVDDEPHLVVFDATSTVYMVKHRLPGVGVAVLAPRSGAGVQIVFRVADAGTIKLGQFVVALSSVTGTRVGIGSVSGKYTLARIDNDGDVFVVRAIDTNISGKVPVGTPLINMFGDVVGIATSISQGDSGGAGTFVAISDIVPLFAGVKGTSTPAQLPTPAP